MAPLLAHSTERAFERVYKAHARDVYRYALAVMGNRADAEDVTQTTFLNAYRSFERGEQPRVPKNWLIAIAHNVCRQRFRQAARRPNEVAFEEDLAEAIVPSDDAPTASDIQRALGQLGFNQRAALVMRELEGRSYAEIAETLELSVSAVETLIFRARRALREQLEGGLTCGEAELAISRQADGTLPRAERGPLRAHLRECPDCARLARSQRAQRSAWKAMGAVPLPTSLGSLFGGGGAGVGAGVGAAVAAKAAAVVVAAAAVGGGGYALERHPSVLPLVGDGANPTAATVRRTTPPARAFAPLRPVTVAPSRAEPARAAAPEAQAPVADPAAATPHGPGGAAAPGVTLPAHPAHPAPPAGSHAKTPPSAAPKAAAPAAAKARAKAKAKAKAAAAKPKKTKKPTRTKSPQGKRERGTAHDTGAGGTPAPAAPSAKNQPGTTRNSPSRKP